MYNIINYTIHNHTYRYDIFLSIHGQTKNLCDPHLQAMAAEPGVQLRRSLLPALTLARDGRETAPLGCRCGNGATVQRWRFNVNLGAYVKICQNFM